MMKIPITRPCIDQTDREAVLKPLETGWLVQGSHVKEFERLFCKHTGATHAKAVSNCTTALHLSLIALGIGRGDKVVVPAFTYVATANAVEYTGAQVVFCDIELDSFNISIVSLKKILDQTPGIKAVIPVHLFGLCADMSSIMALAREYDFRVVEDAACSFDSWIGERHSGTFGEFGCFSFHPRKSITTGEGGMITTGNQKMIDLVASLCDHGASKSDMQRHFESGGSLLPEFNVLGYNYRMTDIQGALGVAQIQKADKIISGRRIVAGWYDQVLDSIPFLQAPATPPGYRHGYQSYVCLFNGGEQLDGFDIAKIDRLNRERNRLMNHLEEKGISVRQGTHAVHTLGYYSAKYHAKPEDFHCAYAADRLSIALPLYCGMTREEFDYVISSISGAFSG